MFIKNIENHIWNLPQDLEIVFGSVLEKYSSLEDALVMILFHHQISVQKRPSSSAFGQMSTANQYDVGHPVAMDETWAQFNLKSQNTTIPSEVRLLKVNPVY